MPGYSEIIPLLIIIKLEQFDYAGATVIASLMLVASFILLLAIQPATGVDPETARWLTVHHALTGICR